MKRPETQPEAPAPAAKGVTIDDTGEARAAAPTQPGPATPDVTLEASRSDAPPAAPSRPQKDDRLDLPIVDADRYEAIAEHARGGLGRVVRAQDRQLRREVAIKEMLDADPGGPGEARFVREALVTARLQHPGIVPVYDAGYWPGGEPFYAMKLVSGRSLRDAIGAAKGLEERLALVPAVLAATQAVAYAHSQGVIHRDLKPSNVMLGPFGETVVVDWGLAKDLDAAAEASDDAARPEDVYTLAHYELTRVGAVVGTPGFMPPEQAAGRVVDERADVYSLGAVLYAVLVGETPGEGAPLHALAAAGAPRDLVAIVRQAMAPAPADRYPHAGALADDLSRFLSGQLVRARRYGAFTRAGRFFSRRRVPLTVAALLGISLLATAVVSVVRIVRARDQAEAAGADLILAQARAFVERDPTATLAWLAKYPPDAAHQEAAVELAADAASRGVARHVLRTPTGLPLTNGALAPDGAHIAAVDGAALWLWDVTSARIVAHVPLASPRIVDYTRDGRLVVLGNDGEVWRLAGDGTGLTHLGDHEGGIASRALDPAGAWLATGGVNGELRIWPLDGGPARVLPGHPGGPIDELVVTPDGHIVSAGADGAIREWTAGDGPARELRPPADDEAVLGACPDGGFAYAVGGQVNRVDAHGTTPLGHRESDVEVLACAAGGAIVTGSADGMVRRWHEGEEPVTLAHHPAPVTTLALGADDAIASGDEAGELRVWRAGAISMLRGHEDVILGLHFRSDGALLSIDRRGTMRWWAPPPPFRLWRAGAHDAVGIVWAATGDAIGTAALDGSVRWQGREVARHEGGAWDLALTPDGRTLISSGWDGELALTPLDGGAARRLDQGGGRIWTFALSPDGHRLVAGAEDGGFRLWDLDHGSSRELHHAGAAANDAAWSRDGAAFAIAASEAGVHVYGADGAERVLPTDGRGGVGRLAFSADGQTLYLAGMDGTVSAQPVAGGAPRVLAHQGHSIRALATSRDGRWLATGSVDGLVLLVEPATGRVRELRGHEANVRDLAFSPDGRWLASAAFDGTIRVWGIGDRSLYIVRGERGKIARVAFSPDGTKLAWSNEDGTVGVGVALSQGQVPGTAELSHWVRAQTTATVGAGAPLATSVATQ